MEAERRLSEQALALLTEAREIINAASDEGLSEEDEGRVDVLMEKHTETKGQADKLKKTRDTRKAIEDGIEEHLRGSSSNDEEGEDEEEDGETRKITPAADESRRENRRQSPERKAQSDAFNRFLRYGQAALGEAEVRVLTEGAEAAGGFLVPEDFRAELIKRIPGLTVIRQRATVGQTSRDVVTVPTVTGGDDMFTSGVRITWIEETPSDDKGLTDPAFGQERIPINKMMAKTRVSKDLLLDSAVDVTSLITMLYAEAVAMAEDQAFLTGNGVERPAGILDSGSGIGNTDAVFVALDTTDVADPIIDAFYAVAQQYRGNGIWIMRSVVEAKIRKVKDTQNQYIWQPGLSAGAPGTILGRPVFSSEFMPADAQNNVVMLFGDMRGYWIFDRLDMEIQRLDERYAEQSQIGYVLTRRLGGQVTQSYMFRTLTRTGA